jgi:hypothetical protein
MLKEVGNLIGLRDGFKACLRNWSVGRSKQDSIVPWDGKQNPTIVGFRDHQGG